MKSQQRRSRALSVRRALHATIVGRVAALRRTVSSATAAPGRIGHRDSSQAHQRQRQSVADSHKAYTFALAFLDRTGNIACAAWTRHQAVLVAQTTWTLTGGRRCTHSCVVRLQMGDAIMRSVFAGRPTQESPDAVSQRQPPVNTTVRVSDAVPGLAPVPVTPCPDPFRQFQRYRRFQRCRRYRSLPRPLTARPRADDATRTRNATVLATPPVRVSAPHWSSLRPVAVTPPLPDRTPCTDDKWAPCRCFHRSMTRRCCCYRQGPRTFDAGLDGPVTQQPSSRALRGWRGRLAPHASRPRRWLTKERASPTQSRRKPSQVLRGGRGSASGSTTPSNFIRCARARALNERNSLGCCCTRARNSRCRLGQPTLPLATRTAAANGIVLPPVPEGGATGTLHGRSKLHSPATLRRRSGQTGDTVRYRTETATCTGAATTAPTYDDDEPDARHAAPNDARRAAPRCTSAPRADDADPDADASRRRRSHESFRSLDLPQNSEILTRPNLTVTTPSVTEFHVTRFRPAHRSNAAAQHERHPVHFSLSIRGVLMKLFART